MGRYRQGRKLFWAALALFLLIVVVPLSVAAVEYWNEHIAGTEVIAYELNNNTLTALPPYPGGAAVSFKWWPSSDAGQELSPFWDANGTWDEVMIPSFTENTTYKDQLAIAWNLTPAQIVSMNIDKLVIEFKGLNSGINDTIVGVYVTKRNAVSDSDVYTLYSQYKNGYVGLNNGTFKLEIKIEPALATYLKQNYEDSGIMIKLISEDPAISVFLSNSIIDFRIYAMHPHGRAVVSVYDATTIILAFWTVIGVVVLFVTSPAWNPTTHNGFIERLIRHRKYAKAAKSRNRRNSRRKRRKRSKRKRRR